MFRNRLLAPLILAVMAAACGSGSVASTATSVPVATSVSTVPAATTTTVEPYFPVEVATDQGRVAIASMPERVVSLSATHTEIIYELGVDDRLVAVDLTSNYPPEVVEKPQIDSFNFNVEEVAALDPDLVIVAFDFQGETDSLRALGIPYLLLGPPTDLQGMYDQFRALGAALGVPESGETLAGEAEEFARTASAGANDLDYTFFHEIDNTLYTAASSSFLGDLYASLGLVNIADSASVDPSNPFPSALGRVRPRPGPRFHLLG